MKSLSQQAGNRLVAKEELIAHELNEIYAELMVNEQQEELLRQQKSVVEARLRDLKEDSEIRRNKAIQLMEEAGVSKYAKMSLVHKLPTLIITDESKVPDTYKKPQKPKIDKKALNENFRETGEIPDGCDLNNGGVRLQVRK